MAQEEEVVMAAVIDEEVEEVQAEWERSSVIRSFWSCESFATPSTVCELSKLAVLR